MKYSNGNEYFNVKMIKFILGFIIIINYADDLEGLDIC